MLHHSPGELDAVFHALADSTRRAMVEKLTRGPASVSELAAPFDMTLSAVGQHIRLPSPVLQVDYGLLRFDCIVHRANSNHQSMRGVRGVDVAGSMCALDSLETSPEDNP